MKNLIFTLAVIVLFTGSSLAQKGLKIGVQFTPGASMSLQNEDFDRGPDLDVEAAFTFNTGLTVGYGFSETFSISTGIMYNKHVSSFVHNREFVTNILGNKVEDPNYKKKFSRTVNYMRVPVLLEVSGDPASSGGFFFRVGPHFDFFSGGRYVDARLDGMAGYDDQAGINLRDEVDLYEPKTLLGVKYPSNTGKKGKVYKDMVIGVTLEMGSQIRISDYLKLIITLHLESSLTNPEDVGAASFAYEWGSATYPNYISEDDKFVTHRDAAYNVMAGMTFGLIYTLDFSK